jgi:asparagine synthase (glutamine-hydrolysing)
MSAIFGIINLNGAPVDPKTVNDLKAALVHRGADGIPTKIQGNIGFGQAKFNVWWHDVGTQGPIQYKHWLLVCTSRLDNRLELGQTLGVERERLDQIADGELILLGFERWGAEVFSRLRGDFSLVIWDTLLRKAYCAIDFAGVRPLFFVQTPSQFIFSTELQALVRLPVVPKRLNEEKLISFLLLARDDSYQKQTFFKDIESILPGRFLVVEAGKQKEVHYYVKRPAKNSLRFQSEEECAEAFREVLHQAVSARIRTRGEVGISLSGGLDSSTIACLAAPQLNSQGKTLWSASSVLPNGHPGIEEDERPYITEVIRQELNIKPGFIVPGPESVFDAIRVATPQVESPINGFFYADRAIASHFQKKGVSVMLSGYGGDGAASYSGPVLPAMLASGDWSGLWTFIGQRARREHCSRWAITRRELIRPFFPSSWIRGYQRLRGEEPFPRDALAPIIPNTEKQRIKRKVASSLFRSKWDVTYTLWNASTYWFPFREQDVVGGRYQFQPVYPLLDQEVVEFLLQIPPRFLQMRGQRRGLIRGAMQGILPEKIQSRKDKTMYVPDFYRRLQAEKRGLLAFFDKHQKGGLASQYLDFEKMKQDLSRVRPVKDWKEADSNLLFTLVFGMSLAVFLDHFEASYT